MKKDIIVYCKSTGLPYIIREVAGQALLCTAKLELSKLAVTRKNSNYDVIRACGDYESEFAYLCDDEGNISAQDLFAYLLYVVNNAVCGTFSDNILDAFEFLMAHNVTIMPWRDRSIVFMLHYDKEQKVYRIDDHSDLGIHLIGFSETQTMIDILSQVIKIIKENTIVENVTFLCKGEHIQLLMEGVMLYLNIKPEEIKIRN